MNPVDQSGTFDEPFSIPSSVSNAHHAILFLLPTSGRSAAKAAPTIPSLRSNKSADGLTSCKSSTSSSTSTRSPSIRPWTLPPRSAPLPTQLSLDCPASSERPRRASCVDDAPAGPASCRPSRWERRPVARRRTAHSADLPDAADAQPPPGMLGCRARYNFQIGLGLAVDELRRRRREAAPESPVA